jgi:hypothetical protein
VRNNQNVLEVYDDTTAIMNEISINKNTYVIEKLNDIIQQGVEIIYEQTQWVEFENYGTV